MVEFRSALASKLIPGRFGANNAEPTVTLWEPTLGHLFQVAGWPDQFDISVQPVLSALGFTGDTRVGHALVSGEQRVFRLAPERILIRSDNTAAWDLASGAADSGALALLDLSHARVRFRIEGASAPDLLARLASLDFFPGAFVEESFALTGLHTVPVMIHRLEGDADAPRYDLYVPYSWAASLWDYICQSALPLGYEAVVSEPTGV